MEDKTEACDEKSTALWKKLLPLVVIIGAMGLVFATGLHRELTLENFVRNRDTLVDWVAANWIKAWLGLIVVYMLSTALSLPIGLYLTIGSGAIFGGLLGGFGVVIGATIGAVILFFAVKLALQEFFIKKCEPFLGALVTGFQKRPLNYMFTLRLIPVFPFWLVNVAPALLGVKLGHYFIGTFFGIIPGTLAFAFIGAGFRATLDAQADAYKACTESSPADQCSVSLDLGSLVKPELLIGLGVLALLSLLPTLINYIKAKKAQD